MNDDRVDFGALLASRCACPRCGTSDILYGDPCRVFAGDGCAPRYDRTTRCEVCGLVWIETLVLAEAYAIDLRDKRVKSATVLYLGVNNKTPPDSPPPGAAA